jgi:hypothetical protein
MESNQQRFADVRGASHRLRSVFQSRKLRCRVGHTPLEHARKRGYFTNLAQFTPIVPACLSDPGAARHAAVDHPAQEQISANGADSHASVADQPLWGPNGRTKTARRLHDEKTASAEMIG